MKIYKENVANNDPSIIITVDFANSSIEPTHSPNEVFYLIRTTIQNNEDIDVMCSGFLDQGILQDKDVETWDSKSPISQFNRQQIMTTPRLLSKISFGKEPVTIESHSSRIGEFVFRLKPSNTTLPFKITVKKVDGEFLFEKKFDILPFNKI